MIITVKKEVKWPEFVSAAISHYAEKLGISQLSFSVAIVSQPFPDHDALCEYTNIGEPNPSFIISICPSTRKNFRRYFAVLAHEMVHVRQYLKREITFKTAKSSSGESYLKEYFKGKRTDNIPYKDKPCEQQALRLQEKLFRSFLSTI